MGFKVIAKNSSDTIIDFMSSGVNEELTFHTMEEAETFIEDMKSQGGLQASYHYSIEEV
ncbi:hypothetical protein [Thalassobacillus hwangdonensis]|uniref:Phage protein n=1 Tax=Thalassobacillus hwangdonensis TaxID=546108 RepID=A0ABW3L6R1_9BACI